MRTRPRPDFIVIGAMKCATTTLHEQLARQPGLFMSRPKEPSFFSDDCNYSRGIEWYHSCFSGCTDEHLVGESSTHYTKLPTHPHTVARMRRWLTDVKLIYVMRHPIERLASHYLHELTVGRVQMALEEAVGRLPELVAYGCYSRQLEPYLQAFGPEAVLPVFFDRLASEPDHEFERIGRFLGAREPLRWDHSLGPLNVGRQRLRTSAVRDALVGAPILSSLRRKLLPRPWAERLKRFWRINIDPPSVPLELECRLRAVFDEDLARLGSWLGLRLDCESFHQVARTATPRWSSPGASRTVRTQGGQALPRSGSCP
jgi:hypothetical protein